MNISQPAQWLEKIAHIQRMERGKLTVMREGPEGPHYKLQSWEKGKNLSRHVSRDQVAAVEQAIAGYRQFQELTEQYAQAVIDQTRAELAANSKKKEIPIPPQILRPRIRKSKN